MPSLTATPYQLIGYGVEINTEKNTCPFHPFIPRFLDYDPERGPMGIVSLAAVNR